MVRLVIMNRLVQKVAMLLLMVGEQVAADDLLDLVVQHVRSQLSALVAVESSLLDVTLVAGNTCLLYTSLFMPFSAR